jgi:hypothetical protein
MFRKPDAQLVSPAPCFIGTKKKSEGAFPEATSSGDSGASAHLLFGGETLLLGGAGD